VSPGKLPLLYVVLFVSNSNRFRVEKRLRWLMIYNRWSGTWYDAINVMFSVKTPMVVLRERALRVVSKACTHYQTEQRSEAVRCRG